MQACHRSLNSQSSLSVQVDMLTCRSPPCWSLHNPQHQNRVKQSKNLWSGVGRTFIFSLDCCTQQRHSHALLAQRRQGHVTVCVAHRRDTTLPHTGEAPELSVAGDHEHPLSPQQAAVLLPALTEKAHTGMELHPVCFPTSLPRLEWP